MHLLVYGPGRLGTAIVGAATAAGWPTPSVVGRPVDGVRRPALTGDVVVDASRGDAVVENLEHAIEAGNRRFVLATTGWDGDTARVRDRRRQEEAVAALPEGLGPGALTARERRPMEPPGPEAPRGRGHH